jgi:hypothetical protein
MCRIVNRTATIYLRFAEEMTKSCFLRNLDSTMPAAGENIPEFLTKLDSDRRDTIQMGP